MDYDMTVLSDLMVLLTVKLFQTRQEVLKPKWNIIS